MKYVYYSFIATLVIAAGAALSAGATSETNFRQQIVPIDCIFDVVSTGPYQVVWVTPEECGQAVTPTEPEQPIIISPQSPTIPIQPEQPTQPAPLSSGAARPFYFPLNYQPSPSITADLVPNANIGIIKLNLYPEYWHKEAFLGKQLQLQVGQAVYFDAHNTTYRITLTEITAHSVQLVITKLAQAVDQTNTIVKYVTLGIGTTDSYAVSTSSKPDIRITPLNIQNGVATLLFKELGLITSSSSSAQKNIWWWLPILILATILLLLFAIRRRQQNQISGV